MAYGPQTNKDTLMVRKLFTRAQSYLPGVKGKGQTCLWSKFTLYCTVTFGGSLFTQQILNAYCWSLGYPVGYVAVNRTQVLPSRSIITGEKYAHFFLHLLFLTLENHLIICERTALELLQH